MPTNLSTRHTQSTKAHLNFGCHPGHLPSSLSLSQHVRPDVKGNIVEGRGSPNNERYTTSPNLILQQMAKCDLWPWQIAVLVKPSSTTRKSESSRRMRLGGIEMAAAEYKDGGDKYLRGGEAEKLSWIKAEDGRGDRVSVWNVDPRVKPDRFAEDQQSKLLWVKLEGVKTQEGDVKNHERPIKSRIRMAACGTKRAGKQLKAGW